MLDGPINGASSLAWAEQFLAPELTAGDIVVIDSLGSHKVAGVCEAIETQGAQLLYLPPYSRDLNPIEQVFSKLKALLRRVQARTVEGLWCQIGQLLGHFTPEEGCNYLRNCGYC